MDYNNLKNVKVIKKFDDEGNPMTLGESQYNNESITHDLHFSQLPETLENLQKFQPKESDVWLVSVPKSGTHWMYEILGILLSGKLEPLTSFSLPSALVEINPDTTSIKQDYDRRLYTTHLLSRYLPKELKEKCKIVYLLRNPKSVAVSMYHFLRNLKTVDYNGSFSGYLPVFNKGIFTFCGSWFENVCDYWKLAQKNDNIMLVFYEDLIKNPSSVIKDISDFLDLHNSKEFCENVAKLASFQNMKEGKGKCKEALEGVGQFFKDPAFKIFRKGQIDEWKNTFTVAQNENFDEVYMQEMAEYPDLVRKISFT